MADTLEFWHVPNWLAEAVASYVADLYDEAGDAVASGVGLAIAELDAPGRFRVSYAGAATGWVTMHVRETDDDSQVFGPIGYVLENEGGLQLPRSKHDGHLQELTEAERYIDTGVSPFALVLIKKGTGGIGVGIELLRQELFDEAGNPITSIHEFIGQQVSV